jgi:hypothetical protein
VKHILAISVVTALVLAGCASGESTTGPAEVAFSDHLGAIRGVVIDDSITAIPNAQVVIRSLDIVVVAAPDGTYVIPNLEPGTYDVEAGLDGYRGASAKIDVVAGAATTHDFTLIPLASNEAYHVIQLKKGRTFCGMAWRGPLPRTNVAGFNVSDDIQFAACGAVYGTPLASFDSFVVIFEISSGDISSVSHLALETHWVRTQTFGSGLSVLWENYQDLVAYTFTEPVRNFTEVEGPSPLIAIVDQQTIWDNMTHWDPPPKYCMPNSTCRFWARVFPFASTFGSSAAADLALYLDQPYDHYVTEFYRKDPPEGYSAIADA